jgi:leucyl-tRNA synthetase
VKYLARVARLAEDVAALPGSGRDTTVDRAVARAVDEVTRATEAQRLNVAVARLMELTSTLRKAVDSGPGPQDPAVREGAEALVRMLSCFAPFTAEEAWERLGHGPSVSDAGWPEADAALLVTATTTCVVQVDGKLRDRITVPVDIDAESMERLARESAKVQQALHGVGIRKVIARPPGLVNIVSAPKG